jgi:hypothetical protein
MPNHDISDITVILEDVYTQDEIHNWMNTAQNGLGGLTPAEAIRQGQHGTVMELAQGLIDMVLSD